MTGFLPAMAKVYEIPCLFTVQRSATERILLSYVEDMGLDVAVFWRHLFYERYPIGYEEIRDSNPANLLLSGIYAAKFVNTSRAAFLINTNEPQNLTGDSPFWEVLAEKKNARCAAINNTAVDSEQYLAIYQKLLKRSLQQPEKENVGLNAAAH
jgi:hypothetical protein